MPNTYTQITIHLIFAVKNRDNSLKKSIRPELFKYMSGIVRNKNHKLLAINGVADHVHLLVGLSPSTALSDLVRDIKNNSSKFINQEKLVVGKFSWQTGYGAFSYSRSQRPSVIEYIENQEKHHKVKTFREEYLEILQKFDVDYESEYLFEFYE